MDAAHHPPASELNAQIHDLIREELGRYDPHATTVDLMRSHGWNSWLVDVVPANDRAAPLQIGVNDAYTLYVVVANGYVEAAFNQWSFDWIRAIVKGVFAGQVGEIGRRADFDSFARIGPSSALTASFGSAHLPLPWALRRVRRYSAYSPSHAI